MADNARFTPEQLDQLQAALFDTINRSGASRNNMASQAAMSDRMRGQNSNGWNLENGQQRNPYARRKDPLDQFEEAFAKELLDSVAGGDFKKNINKALNNFSKEMGFSINELPTKVGQQMAKDFAKSNLGKKLGLQAQKLLVGEKGDKGLLGSIGKSIGPQTKNAVTKFIQTTLNLPGTAEGVAAATKGATELAGATAEGAGLVGELSTAIGSALPEIGLAVAAIAVVAKVAEPAIESFSKMLSALTKSAYKEDDLRAKRRESAQKRLVADINYMVEQPFKILTEAAQSWYDTWNSNLQTIGQTQGYDKESVYNLYASYAERLREENLGSVISSTSIIDGLKQVLGTGLSGKAAEEFAYQATKLQAIIPNMDFFQYAGSYAQIAANAMVQGASQAEALELANEQLESFANNVLYANRELAGGFNTGLSNSSQLFADAVKIAQTARTGNTSAISGVLTSVSAVVGAVAPDLATGLVDNIVKAAIGGNSESIVALRSLAGINASNTEFLRAFAENPQSVFSNLFNKLAELQTMSNDNFMEVAEGLSPIFGVDVAALAQVDFNYLARAVDQMNINSGSLEENLELLASGETTTTAEQAKMAEINQMILDEGLGVVIDNEAAQMIQQHMWDEQMTNAITSAQYGVELQGASYDLLYSIAQTVTTISRFMHPLDALEEAFENIDEVLDETMTQRQVLNEILVKGAVKGSNSALQKLIDYSGVNPIDIFNEGLTSSNYSHITDTRLSSMLFGASGVEGSTYYQNMSAQASDALSSAADTAMNAIGVIGDYTGHSTLSAIADGYDAISQAANIINSSDALSNAADTIGDIAYNQLRGVTNAPITLITDPLTGYGDYANANTYGNAIAQAINDELIDPIYFDNFDKSDHDSIRSQYGWGTVGKSSAKFLSTLKNEDIYTKAVGALLGDETETNKGKLRTLLSAIDSINQTAVNLDPDETTGKFATKMKDVLTTTNKMSYDDWVKSEYGDRDSYLEAIEAYGTSEAAVKSRFEAGQARSSAAAEEVRADATFAFNQDARNIMAEMRKFWDFEGGSNGVYETAIWHPYIEDLSNFWGYNSGNYYTQFWHDFYDDGMKFDQGILTIFNEMVNQRDHWIGQPTDAGTVRGLLNTINENLVGFSDNFSSWVQEWTDYYINHTTYSARTSSADWNEMLNMEQSTRDDISLALANSLEAISNIEDLKDPTVQSNVLLAKIVVLLEAIMQQNNSTGGLSLIDTISAMSLGVTNRT